MRYFNIVVTNAQTGKPILQADGQTPFGPYSSTTDGTVSGANLPGAYNVELDLPVNAFDEPVGFGIVKIWGVGIAAITQATAMNPVQSVGQNGPVIQPACNIQIYGGMRAGLPLANPLQAGLLLQAQVQQCWGNWENTEQSIEFQVGGPYSPPSNSAMPGTFGSPSFPVNISFNWQTGHDLAAAVTQTLQNAFPGCVVANNCQSITLPYEPQPGQWQSLGQFSSYVRGVSQQLIQGGYQGIRIAPTPTGFNLFDGTAQPTPVQINFVDLIGQPCWKDVATINFKCPMRADLSVGQLVTMPLGPILTSASSNSAYRNQSAFQGTFQLVAMRHLGHSRQYSADSWVTSFDAVIQTKTPKVTVGAVVPLQ